MNKKSNAYSRNRGRILALCAVFAAILVVTLLSVSCATKLPPIPEQISSAEIIQKAQERSDLYDWKGAQYYYKALLERYPDDANLVVTAMYELAFIEYKQDHFDTARAGFTAVLEKYAAPGGDSLPKAWKILSEKVLAKLPTPVTK
ncbi:MAG TPA: hypothetical protein VN437_07705 [Rectinemataceae bacterium]|nr:hypothetical protein [Rectinemataceae bacterium]